MYNGKIQRIYNVTEKIKNTCIEIAVQANGLSCSINDYIVADVNKNGHILLLYKMGMITGGFIKGHTEQTEFDTLFKIDWFYVRPRFQWQGIGEKLMTQCLDYAVRDDAQFCYLYTSNEKSANRFYEKHGFKENKNFFCNENVWVKPLQLLGKQNAAR